VGRLREQHLDELTSAIGKAACLHRSLSDMLGAAEIRLKLAGAEVTNAKRQQ
jgi:hypothetical protein